MHGLLWDLQVLLESASSSILPSSFHLLQIPLSSPTFVNPPAPTHLLSLIIIGLCFLAAVQRFVYEYEELDIETGTHMATGLLLSLLLRYL